MSALSERATHSPEHESELSSPREPREGAALATVALGTMLAPLNSTMIAVALPHIVEEFHVDVAAAGWLVTAYLITMAAIQPVAGKLGDRFGRRRLIIGGLLFFGIASLGAAVAPGLEMVLLFRLMQAFSGAVALPNGVALLTEVIPRERRASSFGIVGAAASLAAAAGPPLGGLLLSGAGWRVLFFANVPVVTLALLLGWSSIPRTSGRPRERNSSFDLAGALLLFVGLSGLAGLLTQARQGTSLPLLAVGAFVLLFIFALFVRHELGHRDPVVKLALFGRRAFTAACGANALSNLAMYVLLLAIPLLLAQRPGWTSGQTGLVLAVLFGVMILFSPVGGRIADRTGRRRPAVAGMTMLALGVLPLLFAGNQIGIPLLLAGLALSGIGLGLSGASLQASAMDSVEAGDAGVAAGVYSTSRYFGSIVGSSLLAGLLGTTYSGEGFRAVFIMVASAAFLAVLLALTLPVKKREPGTVAGRQEGIV